jgi:hypothetical protein
VITVTAMAPVFVYFCLLLSSTFIYSNIHVTAINAISQPTTPKTYIVIVRDHLSSEIRDSHHRWLEQTISRYNVRGGSEQSRAQIPFELKDSQISGLKHTYNINEQLVGYSGHFDDGLIEEIRRNTDVWREKRVQNPEPYVLICANNVSTGCLG